MRGCLTLLLTVLLPQMVAAQPRRPALGDLRSNLCGRHEESDFPEAVFYWERELRTTIRSLLKTSDCARALDHLALIGEPSDIRFILHQPRPRTGESQAVDWAYGVVCALVAPRSEREWQFLQSAAFNEYDDPWVDAGAIQSLKLIASPRSRDILVAAQQKNPSRSAQIGKALDYVRSTPSPLQGKDLEDVGKRVAAAIQIGEWEGNSNTRFNHAGDKALIDFDFLEGRDRLTYTATFHRLRGVWRLRGVRETLQVLLPPPIVPKPDERP